MSTQYIYKQLRKRSPMWYGEAPELLDHLKKIPNVELLKDLENVYQEWGRLQKQYWDTKQNDVKRVQQCETLFDFILHAIFNHSDPSVIPKLLKYVPSDNDDEDLVCMEDYSSEPLINGICNSRYFGESYIPELLHCIHELLPRATEKTYGLIFTMLYDNFDYFFETQPLIQNLYLVQKKYFKKILDNFIQKLKLGLDEYQKSYNNNGVIIAKKNLERIECVRQEFLKICEQ
ncbi:hypothetical protein P618_201102 [Holospora obtusa F1]|uniref:Uncharacterized protein n=1 Tax=Holospora obtusa F1 TaxID=1399147 RepID=W6TD04_HOLOB|nr:hypothetical protein [Holospora obtusa]ETZ06728.1 hypothetical protein P618_201102 [Holospora obtusa F1]